jgi:hypothetical protein
MVEENDQTKQATFYCGTCVPRPDGMEPEVKTILSLVATGRPADWKLIPPQPPRKPVGIALEDSKQVGDHLEVRVQLGGPLLEQGPRKTIHVPAKFTDQEFQVSEHLSAATIIFSMLDRRCRNEMKDFEDAIVAAQRVLAMRLMERSLPNTFPFERTERQEGRSGG